MIWIGAREGWLHEMLAACHPRSHPVNSCRFDYTINVVGKMGSMHSFLAELKNANFTTAKQNNMPAKLLQ